MHRDLKASRYASGEEMRRDLAAAESRLGARGVRFSALLRRPRVIAAAALLLLVTVAATTWYAARISRARWARYAALPEIERLVEQDEYAAAFRLAREAGRYIADDPRLQRLIGDISYPASLRTTPPGANVYWKGYRSTEESWELPGQTPAESVRIPFGAVRFRIGKEGMEPIEGGMLGVELGLQHFTLEPLFRDPPRWNIAVGQRMTWPARSRRLQ